MGRGLSFPWFAMIEGDALNKLIPHGGKMCLLDKVVEWNNSTIHCETSSHLDSSNPLWRNEKLSSDTGIEYAAQAIAVHGSLISEAPLTSMQQSYLAAVRDVKFEVNWLHDIDHPLTIRAERLIGDQHGLIYRFSLHAMSRLLLEGRITVMLSSPEHHE